MLMEKPASGVSFLKPRIIKIGRLFLESRMRVCFVTDCPPGGHIKAHKNKILAN